MAVDDDRLCEFLDTQIREHAGKLEIEPGKWLLLAVPALDQAANATATELLGDAPFAHEAGISDDDRWMLYYVDSPSRAGAVHWLEDRRRIATGEIRAASPEHQALVRELAASEKPHRCAQQLAELHDQSLVGAGMIDDPAVVRMLLDRLHRMEPLFFAAFQSLLAHHLIDLVVLLARMIPEDVQLKNNLVRASLSHDPFLQSRQDAAAGIRRQLLRFHVINPLDQQRNSAITNPYAAYLELVREGEIVSAPIDGLTISMPCRNFLQAIRSIRRNLYVGGQLGRFNTQVPWVTAEIAHPFRFIKQKLEARPDLAPLDGLYMLERAVAA